MKQLLIQFGLWCARLGGWQAPVCSRVHLPDDSQVELVRGVVRDIDERHPHLPGPVKAREALRVLLNIRPEAAVRDLNLLIELALQ